MKVHLQHPSSNEIGFLLPIYTEIILTLSTYGKVRDVKKKNVRASEASSIILHLNLDLLGSLLLYEASYIFVYFIEIQCKYNLLHSFSAPMEMITVHSGS